MPLKMMATRRGAGPIVVCDHCGKRIDNASDANYEWFASSVEPGTLFDIYLLHKACVRSHEASLGVHLDSNEMIDLLPFLVDNVRLDWDRAREHANMVNSFDIE